MNPEASAQQPAAPGACLRLTARPLSRAAFAPFGDVVAVDEDGAGGRIVNQQTSRRFDHLVSLDLVRGEGAPRASLFRPTPAALPVRLRLMERHPLGSQLFLPLGIGRFLVVVGAQAHARADGEGLIAFVTDGRQGVNYRAGTWHHPLIALDPADYLVVDRQPDSDNYEEVVFAPDRAIEVVL